MSSRTTLNRLANQSVCLRSSGSDDPASALFVGQCVHRVVAAAELEGPHALEVLGLQEDLAAEKPVEGAGSEDGGAVGDPLDARGGGFDVLELEHGS